MRTRQAGGHDSPACLSVRRKGFARGPAALCYNLAVMSPLLAIALSLLTAPPSELPAQIPGSRLAAIRGEREFVQGPRQALLLSSHDARSEDPLHNLPFSAAVGVYTDEAGAYQKRFTIHLPERSHLNSGRRAARFLALLWGMADRRYGSLCARLRQQPVDVWFTAGGQAGAEMSRNSLYVYDLLADRSGLEWARELAHEFGHYLLPGASGYREPESWANGVLGERLFLKWLREDLRAGRLDPAEVPYVKLPELDDYCAKQVTPLIEQIQQRGPDAATIKGEDRRATNAFTGLLLYSDTVYGSRSVMNMLAFLPRRNTGHARGVDFLSAFQDWAAKVSPRVSMPSGAAIHLYLPAGPVRLRSGSGIRASLTVERRGCVPKGPGEWALNPGPAGWYRVRAAGAGPFVDLTIDRAASKG